MKYTEIRISNVQHRRPYYIQCNLCDNTIEGFDANEVVSEAQRQDYKYNYENDEMLCSNCYDYLPYLYKKDMDW